MKTIQDAVDILAVNNEADESSLQKKIDSIIQEIGDYRFELKEVLQSPYDLQEVDEILNRANVFCEQSFRFFQHYCLETPSLLLDFKNFTDELAKIVNSLLLN